MYSIQHCFPAFSTPNRRSEVNHQVTHMWVVSSNKPVGSSKQQNHFWFCKAVIPGKRMMQILVVFLLKIYVELVWFYFQWSQFSVIFQKWHLKIRKKKKFLGMYLSEKWGMIKWNQEKNNLYLHWEKKNWQWVISSWKNTAKALMENGHLYLLSVNLW